MKKIPFDIKYRPQIESGKYKVQTREGRTVTIGIWNMNAPKPIVGCYQYNDDGDEKCGCWYKNGSYSDVNEHVYDLFVITPEPELTELERAIKRGMLCAGAEGVSTTIIKETAKEVKNIICKGCTVGLDQYWKGREDARKEYEKGNTYHYPDPPFILCQFGGICNNPMRDCLNCPMHSTGLNTTTTTSGTCKKED